MIYASLDVYFDIIIRHELNTKMYTFLIIRTLVRSMFWWFFAKHNFSSISIIFPFLCGKLTFVHMHI